MDIYTDLKAFQKSRLDTWAIPWNVHNYLHSNLMVYPPDSYILNNSHLFGAERTTGIQFEYEFELSDSEIELALGYLHGLTDASANHALLWNFEFEFN